MFKYEKILNYPVNIKTKDLKMAKLIITQLGGFAGELGAALRYFCQKFTMPDDEGKALLNDIATEELGHVEMISSIVTGLIKNASLKELEDAGLDGYFVEHGKAVYPLDVNGVSFDTKLFAVTGDPIVDLEEDLAAEEKARIVYERLIDNAKTEDLIAPLLFLRQREIVHYNRFKELLDKYKSKQNKNLKNID